MIMARQVLPMTAPGRAESPPDNARRGVSSRLVLVVDSDPDARTIMRRLLEHHGYQAVEAVDHDTALDIARERDIALIVSELFVSCGESTTCLLESVRRDERLSDVPVLIVTTRAFGADEQRALRAGSAGYIVKPFAATDVMTQVARLLNAPVV
jgi:CheY-like chemotaxis protein